MTRPGAPLSELLRNAGVRTDVSEADAAVYRAAITTLGQAGTRKVTVDAIAAECGLSRMTLFRRFGSKDDILVAAIAWWNGLLLTETTEVIARTPDVAERIEEVFVLCCRFSRVLLPVTQSEEIATLFADERIDPMSQGIGFVADYIAREQEAGTVPPGGTAVRADALVRLTTACILLPPAPFDLYDDDAARAYARAALVPIVLV